jgi:hypothetical protein
VVNSFGRAGREGGVEQSWEGIFHDPGAILLCKIDYRDKANNMVWFAAEFGIGIRSKAVECTP